MRAWICGLVAMIAGCSAPTKLGQGICGNGVVEPGEDCEAFDGRAPGTVCASAGQPHECQFVCDPESPALQCPRGSTCSDEGTCISAGATCGNGIIEDGEDCEATLGVAEGTCGPRRLGDNGCHYVCDAEPCPAGLGCGLDHRCRAASGVVEDVGSTFVAGSDSLEIADVNGDRVPDVVTATLFADVAISYGAGDGTFPSTTVFPVTLVAPPAIGDCNDDGHADLVLQTPNAIAGVLGRSNGSLLAVPFPELALADIGDHTVGDIDMWIPMRADAASPFHQLLHVQLSSERARLAFDERPEHPDASPVVLPGPHISFGTHAPRFPVADLVRAPGAGGDEIVIGFAGETTLHLFTATADGPIAKLSSPRTIALPGPLLDPPLVADFDGDGALDVLAHYQLPNGLQAVAVARGNGVGAFGAAAMDAGLSTAGFPLAAANLTGNARAELVVGDEVRTAAQALLGRLPGASGEAAFADFNRDGLQDVVMPTQRGLELGYGSQSGVFSPAFVPTDGRPFNLRTGDFDGDRSDDVMFLIRDSARTTLHVLYGATSGLPAPPSSIAGWPTVRSAEPALLAGNHGFDATADIVVEQIDSTGAAGVTFLLGDASRSLLTTLPMPTFASPVVAGRFTAGATADELLAVAQDYQAFHAIAVVSVGTDAQHQPDGSFPRQRFQNVAAFTGAQTFDGNVCTKYVAGDLEGDGVAELIGVHGCGAGSNPRLLVLHTEADSTEQPTTIATSLRGIQRLALADLDADGHRDLIAMFAGDPYSCTTFACVPAGNGVLVLWGVTGGFAAHSELPAELGPGPGSRRGTVLDVAAANLDRDARLELAVAATHGLFAFHVEPDRRLVLEARPLVAFDGTQGIYEPYAAFVAAADLDGDGVTDLVIDDAGTAHVFRGVASAVAR